MRFLVKWFAEAESQLAAIWQKADNRDPIRKWVHRFESDVHYQPHKFGSWIIGTTRAAHIGDLLFIFDIVAVK